MTGQAPTKHVVVIDDEQPLLQLYREVLTDEGFRVTLLDHLSDEPSEILGLAPNLIVLDLIYQGDPRGLPFLYRLRADPIGSAIPVIVSSAAANLLKAHETEMEALGAVLLAKPFDIESLLTIASELCAREIDARSLAALDQLNNAAGQYGCNGGAFGPTESSR